MEIWSLVNLVIGDGVLAYYRTQIGTTKWIFKFRQSLWVYITIRHIIIHVSWPFIEKIVATFIATFTIPHSFPCLSSRTSLLPGYAFKKEVIIKINTPHVRKVSYCNNAELPVLRMTVPSIPIPSTIQV